MGPMAVSAHAGGEFVFARNSFPWQRLFEAGGGQDRESPVGPTTRSASGPRPADVEDLVENALVLENQGASNAAQLVLRTLLTRYNAHPLARAVAAELEPRGRATAYDDVLRLIDRLQGRGSTNTVAGNSARPRIIACLGPTTASSDDAVASRALLYRASLREELSKISGCLVVDRDVLEPLLQEMDVGSSEVADRGKCR